MKSLISRTERKKLRVVGVKQPVPFYTLDVIISVGYRVKSKRGIEFRRMGNIYVRTITDQEAVSPIGGILSTRTFLTKGVEQEIPSFGKDFLAFLYVSRGCWSVQSLFQISQQKSLLILFCFICQININLIFFHKLSPRAYFS